MKGDRRFASWKLVSLLIKCNLFIGKGFASGGFWTVNFKMAANFGKIYRFTYGFGIFCYEYWVYSKFKLIYYSRAVTEEFFRLAPATRGASELFTYLSVFLSFFFTLFIYAIFFYFAVLKMDYITIVIQKYVQWLYTFFK